MSIKFGSSLSLNEFANTIATVGSDVTVIGQGEPGIGKSSMLKAVSKRFPDYEVAYIDCTLLDLGDFALPYTELVSDDLKVTKFAPNARFKFQSGKPVIVMLDEIGKAMKAVKNVLLTLMLEKRIGADGSVDADSWGAWALDNDIAPEIIAWVKQFPHALESYTDGGQKDNPYIFNPTKAGQSAFVTPRSLEKASHIAKKRSLLGEAVTISALAGTIGESAARDMQAFFTVVDKLPTWEAIMDSPATAKVPDDAVAKCILVFSALTRVDKDTLGKWLKYADRLDKELQALFARSLVKSSNKQSMAVSNKEFVKWATDNQWLF